MSLVVQKYGGTSMGSIERIRNVARRVARTYDAGNDMVVVVSAMSGETNKLVALANEICDFPDNREYDVLVASGEQVSIALLAICLKSMGYKAKSYHGWQVPIITDSAFSKARIEDIPDTNMRRTSRTAPSSWWPDFRGSTPPAMLPRWVAAGQTPRRWPWPRR